MSGTKCEPVENSGIKGELHFAINTLPWGTIRDERILQLINAVRDLEKEHNDGDLTDYGKEVMRTGIQNLSPFTKVRLKSEFIERGWIEE